MSLFVYKLNEYNYISLCKHASISKYKNAKSFNLEEFQNIITALLASNYIMSSPDQELDANATQETTFAPTTNI